MKKDPFYIFLVSGALFITGCSGSLNLSAPAGTRYVYPYTMEHPVQTSDLKFRDDQINIIFSIDAAAINFELHNLTDQHMSIVWERAAFGMNKRMFPVRNNTTLYSFGNDIPQPLSVPPQGYLRETVIPWPHVNFEKGRWIERDLFPTNDSGSLKIKEMIATSAGSEISLILPLRIGKLVIDYTFTFKAGAAIPLAPGTAPAEKERPPKPDAPLYESSVMQGYFPIIISAGILVVAIYLFSQKKTPAEGI